MSPSFLRAGRLILTTLAAVAALPFINRPAEAQPTPFRFHACYVPASGTVYVIKTPDGPSECRSKTHVEFQWTDYARSLDYFTRHAEFTVAAGGVGAGSLECPLGTLMHNGGYVLHDEQMRPLSSLPHTGDLQYSLRTWMVRVKNESTSPQQFSIWVRCTKP